MLMPNVIAISLLVAIGSCIATNSMCQSKANPPKQQDSLLVDMNGNKYPIKLFPDSNLWMTANLNLNIANSYCYEDINENCELYGRLYTWASAQEGCTLLGEGWRLPTNDEWEQLATLYGGVYKRDSVGSGKSAYQALLKPGNALFNALLGGGRAPDGEYGRLDAHGFYWTATEIDTNTAWFINFGKGSKTLYQQDGGEKAEAFSVRCVKTMDTSK